MRGVLLFLLFAAPVDAQPLLFDDFETAGFVATDGGFQVFSDTDPLSTFEWTDDAGVVTGQRALLVRRTMATGSGPNSTDGLFAFITPRSPTLTAQTWARITSTSGAFGVWPLQLHGSGNPNGTNAELVVNPQGRLVLTAFTRDGKRECVSGVTLPDEGWHLYELLITGDASADGGMRGFVDGQAFCSETHLDWTGLPTFRALTGTTAFDRAWVGALVLDAFRVVDGVPVNALRVGEIDRTMRVGECQEVRLELGSIDDAGLPDHPLEVELTERTLDGGVLSVEVGTCFAAQPFVVPLALFRPTVLVLKAQAPGDVVLSVRVPGLLGGQAATVRISPKEAPDAGLDAGTLDAGVVEVPDAGVADAPAPGAYLVGCACDSTPALGWGVVLMALLRGRTRWGG